MAPYFCTMCDTPAEESSSLCAQHRAQAAAFSASFGSDDGAPGSAGAPVGVNDNGGNELGTLLGALSEGLGEVARWAEGGGTQPKTGCTNPRWPQLAFFYLRGQLKQRRYYGVARSPPHDADRPSYPLTEGTLRAAFNTDGELFKALGSLFTQRHAALERGELVAVCIDFRTDQNAIVLSEATDGRGERELMRFTAKAGRFEPAPKEP